MQSSMKGSTELVRVLIESTCTYTAMHISNEKNRFAYVRAMSRCLNTCNEKATYDDMSEMRKALLAIKMDARKNLKTRFELISNTNGYYMLGICEALDVLESINRRFERGYSHSDEFFVRSILRRFNAL